jgi:hypothetical protein
MNARQFFDPNGNVQNTYGRSLDDAIQLMADGLTGKAPKANGQPIVQVVKVVRVDLTNAGRTTSVNVVGEASADAFVRSLALAKEASS